MNEDAARIRTKTAATASRYLVVLAFAATIGLAGSRVNAEERLPPDLQPYNVSLSVGFSNDPDFGRGYRDETLHEIEQLLDRTVGERWSLTVARDVRAPRDAAALSRWTSLDMPIERNAPVGEAAIGFPAETAPDKQLYVVIATQGAEYVIAAREWDRLTDTLGPVHSTATSIRHDVARTAVAALLAVFRPVARIGSTEDPSESVVPMTARAASIPTPDPAAGRIEAGTLFLPHLRRFHRDGYLDQVRPIPYTLLRSVETDDGRFAAEVHSALRSSLGSRRGRVEAWAIAAPPAGTSTRITLIRQDDGVPLAGRIVEVRDKPFIPGKEQPPAAISQLTDRSGTVEITADAKRPIAWVTLRSGTAVLMRFPLAPGLVPTLTLELGDDVRRLDAEGRLAVLTGELIETVAKRATLLAKARSGARSGRYADAEAAVAEASKLPDAAAFRRRIAAVEAPAAKEAEDAGDRLAAARIRSLGRKAAGLVDRYLSADSLRATREEVEELKRTDPDRDAKQG